MTSSTDPGAASRRLVARALFLVLPMVAIGVALPRVIRHLRGPTAVPTSLDGPLVPGAAPSPEAPPPKPESPTPEQIEKAREAKVALGRAEKGWEKVTVIAPRAGIVGEDGLETLPFQGFGVSVDSEPVGATVTAGGVELGETPLVASVRCAPGSDVKVRVEKPPLPAWERAVRCRADTLVKLSAKLGP